MPDPTNLQRKPLHEIHCALRWMVIFLLLTGVAGFAATAKSGLRESHSRVGIRLLRSTKIVEDHFEADSSRCDLSLKLPMRKMIRAAVPCHLLPKHDFVFRLLSASLSVRQLRSPPTLS